MGTSKPTGVIFDMDGVLVDSEPFICRAAIAMLAEKGVTAVPEDFVPYVGTGENSYLGNVARKYGLELDLPVDKPRTYEIFFELIKEGMDPLPGALKFVAQCRRRGLRLAVASSADRCKVDANLEAIKLDPLSFDAIITGDDVVNKKPAPDIFLAAAKAIELPAEDCLVIEDAPSGVAAALAAGARCLALSTTVDADKLSNADWIAPNLAHAPSEALVWEAPNA